MTEPQVSRRPPLLVFLALLVFAECALLAAIAVFFIFELLVTRPDSYASAIAIILLVAIAAIWLAIVGVNTLRGRSWVRGAVTTWQVLQIAIGITSFQGTFGRADIGWFLVVPAAIAMIVLFTPSVVAATRQTEA